MFIQHTPLSIPTLSERNLFAFLLNKQTDKNRDYYLSVSFRTFQEPKTEWQTIIPMLQSTWSQKSRGRR